MIENPSSFVKMENSTLCGQVRSKVRNAGVGASRLWRDIVPLQPSKKQNLFGPDYAPLGYFFFGNRFALFSDPRDERGDEEKDGGDQGGRRQGPGEKNGKIPLGHDQRFAQVVLQEESQDEVQNQRSALVVEFFIRYPMIPKRIMM